MKVSIYVIHFTPQEDFTIPDNAKIIQIEETGTHVYLAWVMEIIEN